MSNTLNYTGRLAGPVTLTNHGDKKVAKFTLIRNEYAGRNDDGSRKDRKVAIQFTAFNGRAEALAENARKGDQLIVVASVTNNDYKKGEEMVYGFNFIVDSFEYGAPGSESRDRLAQMAEQD